MTAAQIQVTDCPLDRVRPPEASTRSLGPVIAVDLGTTMCRVAVLKQGTAVCVPTGRADGTPSFVALGPGGRVVTGSAARQQQASVPALATWGIKGLLAAPFGDPKMRWLYDQLRCQLVKGDDGLPAAVLGNRTFAARELAAMLLVEARERAQNFLSQPIYRAVVTVPPTRKEDPLPQTMTAAAALAGLHLERVISEPTAVALGAFPRRPGKAERTAVVCDWGGGHFQASLVRYSARQCQVLATDGNVSLCGFELDKRVLERLLRSFPQGVRLAADRTNPAALYRLAGAAEFAKIQLSEQTETRIRVPLATVNAAGQAGDFETVFTRKELESMAKPLIDSALRLCEQVLSQKTMFPGDVDEVLLVGEQCRMPLFRQRVQEFFVQVPIHLDEPGQAAVLSAVRLGGNSTPPPASSPPRSVPPGPIRR
ncbi:Hsp70 family protein [Stigmatella aurantiaca]|uniref:Chaperone protein DnaK, putative n=1 Tax=Stigmatella aurantiaca (strain DW4/3-1) TaxID=378806 RepID=Q08P77_STIAD|nr:Hsp70 family protein [Stigmatella aurantiaca]ADO73308.1 Chaperone protein DnaK-like protein [Stigmatella aurantiaca DW4/3-1]EAU62290.1 chaperone protein DnaK, putative [Stigmatella aurantiaca DW4/3-1]